jgi:MFS family permease
VKIPRTVWALGLVSMCMDISSEMIHSLLPVFLVFELRIGAAAVGLIEGAAEGIALIVRSFSGVLSDRLGRRKSLALAGYGLGALTKPLFALASGAGLVFAARFMDRIGKGVRGAPRDALIADVTPAEVRGAAYGLRQSLDTVGAFLGPLLAMACMLATSGSYRTVFWLAVVPGFAAVAILALAVTEPEAHAPGTRRPALSLGDIGRLGAAYWLVVGFGALFTLARFSEAFLLLRAGDVGIPVSLIPAVLVAMNVVYALTAYPAGFLSDHFGRSGPIAAGLAALVAADLVLAAAGSIWVLAIGVALWGLHMGLTQGILAAMIADTATAARRGTAFGLFSLASGVATLLASVIAGFLWDRYGAPAAFHTGAGFACAALAVYLWLRKQMPENHP